MIAWGRPSWKEYDNQNEKSNENIQPRIMYVRFQRIQNLLPGALYVPATPECQIKAVEERAE